MPACYHVAVDVENVAIRVRYSRNSRSFVFAGPIKTITDGFLYLPVSPA